MNVLDNILSDPPTSAMATGYGGTFTTLFVAFIDQSTFFAMSSGVLGLCLTAMSIYTMYQNKIKNDIDIRHKEIELMQKELELEKLQKSKNEK